VSSRNNLSSLLDDLVGAGEQRGRHFEAKSDSSSAAAGGIATGNGTGAGKPESQPGLDQKIEADNGSYLIKIVDKPTDAEALLIFIGPNQTFETKVALGTYKVRGASGDTWYGASNLFGPSTSFWSYPDRAERALPATTSFNSRSRATPAA
jgi:hypothetical protein